MGLKVESWKVLRFEYFVKFKRSSNLLACVGATHRVALYYITGDYRVHTEGNRALRPAKHILRRWGSRRARSPINMRFSPLFMAGM